MEKCQHRNYEIIAKIDVTDLPVNMYTDHAIQVYSYNEKRWVDPQRWIVEDIQFQDIPDLEGEIAICHVIPPEEREHEDVVHGEPGWEGINGD